MTRFLTNKLGGELTANDEAIAKEVLRTKALIGLLKRKNESIERFKQYFGWKIDDSNIKKVECEEMYLEWGWTSKEDSVGIGTHNKLDTESEEWKILRTANSYDIRLYEYAEKLFEVQGILLDGDHVDYIEPDIPLPITDPLTEEETYNLNEQQNFDEDNFPSPVPDDDPSSVSDAEFAFAETLDEQSDNL